jgi:hypothetical protein
VVTYFFMALAVAMLAGLTGAMPIPVRRIPGSAEDSEADLDTALQKHSDHRHGSRRLPPEILDALADVQRITVHRRSPGPIHGSNGPGPLIATARAVDDVRSISDPIEDEPTT